MMNVDRAREKIEELVITIKAREEDIDRRKKRIIKLTELLKKAQWESDHWKKAYYDARGDI